MMTKRKKAVVRGKAVDGGFTRLCFAPYIVVSRGEDWLFNWKPNFFLLTKLRTRQFPHIKNLFFEDEHSRHWFESQHPGVGFMLCVKTKRSFIKGTPKKFV